MSIGHKIKANFIQNRDPDIYGEFVFYVSYSDVSGFNHEYSIDQDGYEMRIEEKKIYVVCLLA